MVANPVSHQRVNVNEAEEVVRLSDDWRIITDGIQWIVQQWRSPRWRSKAFVHSTKVVLRRVITELAPDISRTGLAALDHLPDRFTAGSRER
jgi:hypothetical protein